MLSRKNYSEADRILVLFTKHLGKVSVIAKGVRKPKSKKRSSIEVFSKIKFSAVKSRSLDIITEADLLEYWQDIRINLKKVSVAYFFVETVQKLTQEEEKNEKFYSLLVKSLERLRLKPNLKAQRQQFVYNTLVLMGYWPEGKPLQNFDQVLEDVVEREMTSKRVGKIVNS